MPEKTCSVTTFLIVFHRTLYMKPSVEVICVPIVLYRGVVLLVIVVLVGGSSSGPKQVKMNGLKNKI